MAFELLKVGTDTEFFLRDAKTKLPEVAIGKFGGTKENPIPIEALGGNGFCIQEDNVMPEINIPAAASAAEFVKNSLRILQWLKEEAKEKGCTVEIVPSMIFDPIQLKHPQAKHIGCEPDFCVWTRSENEFDQKKRHLLETLRSAGGHVHVSFRHTYRKLQQQDQELLVMFCDLLMGVPSILIDKEGHDRKQLYGKAGSFRFKDYGIEYRTLSNFWWKTSSRMTWIFNQAQSAIAHMNEKSSIRLLYDSANSIQSTINNNDPDEALNLVHTWGIHVPQ